MKLTKRIIMEKQWIEVEIYGNIDSCDCMDQYAKVTKIDLVPGVYHVDANIPYLRQIEILSIKDRIIVKIHNKILELEPNKMQKYLMLSNEDDECIDYYESNMDKNYGYLQFEMVKITWKIKKVKEGK